MTSIGVNMHLGLNKERHMNLGSLIKHYWWLIKALGFSLSHRLVPMSVQFLAVFTHRAVTILWFMLEHNQPFVAQTLGISSI